MAATKHVLKFSSIVAYFSEADEMKLISRGENSVESNHVKSFHFVANLGLLRGEIHASMRDRTYKVEVELDRDGSIQGSTCTCPRGQYLCHHIAAVCIYGHYNISVTDVECHWTSRKTIQEDVKTVTEMYMPKSHRSVNRLPGEEEVESFRNNLETYGTSVGYSWLLRPEPVPKTQLVRDVEEFVFSEEYCNAQSKVEVFQAAMMISSAEIENICKETIGQSKNETWLLARKNRLTASNFGFVLAAIHKNKYPPSLFKRLTAKARQQGIDAFQEITGLEVTWTGLWLDVCVFLGASPDGLVGDNAILEIKCPYKYRTKMLEEELEKDSKYILRKINNEFHLNKEHEYYHKMQGTLLITNKMLCYLIIWTPQTSIIHEVHRDEEWSQNFGLLKEFYVEKYLQYLVGNISFS